MVDTKQRVGLERDFGRKRDTYFESNYRTETVQNSLRRERRDQIVKWIEGLSDLRRVLDVGCGPALLWDEAYSRCDKYYAMDLVESNLERVGERWDVERIQEDLDSLDWRYEAPTLIVCSGCLEYTQAPLQNLTKLSRMLEVGGVLVFSCPNALSPYRIWFEYGYRQLVRALDRSDRQPAYGRTLFRSRGVGQRLEAAGMEIQSMRRLGFCFIPPPFDNWLPNLAFRTRKALEMRVPSLGRFSTEFLVLARKRA